jgi:WD40 repeat protein
MVRLGDPSTGQPAATLQGHTGWVRALAFPPTATAGADGDVRLWDPITGQRTGTLPGHTGWVRALAFSPNGRHLASAGDDGRIYMWGVPDALQVSELQLGIPVATLV